MTSQNDYNELADYQWLTGPEAARIAADLATNPAPLHRVVEQLRRTLSASRAHLVMELVELRRRAAEKFRAADRMFFTRVGLEQATDEWVASYKAARFSAGEPVADLCCGIGGDMLSIACRGPAFGVDRDPIALHLADSNLRRVSISTAAPTASCCAMEIERVDLSAFSAWHIDPDRRPGGHRTSSPEWSSPGLDVIERLLTVAPHAAIKLSPAAKVPARWDERCALEWISRAGECRQLVAWHGELACDVGRRATIIESSTMATRGRAARTIMGSPNESVPIVSAPAPFVFDVDAAVLAAHLKGALAAEYELGSLDVGASYLTGSAAIVNDAALACFEVIDVLPLRLPILANYFHKRSIGTLEIKKRGVDTDPNKLRRELRLHGNNAATLMLTPVAGRPTAIVARRV